MNLIPIASAQPYIAEFNCGEVPILIKGGMIASYKSNWLRIGGHELSWLPMSRLGHCG